MTIKKKDLNETKEFTIGREIDETINNLIDQIDALAPFDEVRAGLIVDNHIFFQLYKAQAIIKHFTMEGLDVEEITDYTFISS